MLLGSETNLAYKLRLAAAALTDPEKGLAAGDKGVLDISTQRSDGDIRAYFVPRYPRTDTCPGADPVPEEETDPESPTRITPTTPTNRRGVFVQVDRKIV